MAKSKKQEELEQQLAEITSDLQRVHADFQNYQRRVEEEKNRAREATKVATVLKLLPVIDTIERAIAHVPAELADNAWAQGIVSLEKSLKKSLTGMGVARIVAAPGTPFNPEVHEAIQVDDEAEGEHEVVAEELQAGYLLDGSPVRSSMVKVTRVAQ
jgi:molecular chaperone GrpE